MDRDIRHVKRIAEAEALLREVMNRPRPSHGSLELYDRIAAFLRAAPEPRRQITQVIAYDPEWTVLANDGTLWIFDNVKDAWERHPLPDLPQ